MPVTGFERTGMCKSHDRDTGSHHVCLKQVDGFCDVTNQTDWCADKQSWCVCEWAFDDAVKRAGCEAFEVKCDATNALALEHYARNGKADAAACIREQCTLTRGE